jgi:hypothetical protein
MSQSLNSAIAVIGIDIGKNSFHVVGLDDRVCGDTGDALRRHQSGVVTKCLQLPTEMMRTDASFHADQARRHVG